MNKLLKRALMLGTLVVCLATAAWAGNTEMDWVGGNENVDITYAADGFYETSGRFQYADSDDIYQADAKVYFDSNGNVVLSIVESEEETQTSRYEYDENGRLIQYVYVDKATDQLWLNIETYTYDKNGLLTKSHSYVTSNGELMLDDTYSYSYEDSQVTVTGVCNNPTGSYEPKKVYTLDGNGNVIKLVSNQGLIQDESGYWVDGASDELEATTTFTYDEKGNLISTEKSGGDSGTYIYNDKNLCVKYIWTIAYDDADVTLTYEYEYDDNGNIVKVVSSDVNSEITYAKIPVGGSKSSFSDVDAKEYYNAPVIWATENKITKGTGTTTFSPGKGCSRAELVTFLWRAAGEPEPENAKNPFTDVAAGSYYEKAVLWAVEKGITKGVDVGKFAPDQTCTRAQIVTFIYRAAGKPEVTGTNPFTDVEKNDYYDAILWAVENGITKGVAADKFAPNQTCTRAQGVTFLYRGIGLY